MEALLTRHFTLLNDALTKDNKDDISEFIKIFADKFKINWKRDNTIVEFKSRYVSDVSPNQLELFEADAVDAEFEEVITTNGKAKDEIKENVKKLPASSMKQLK
jgi:hypothetical protein